MAEYKYLFHPGDQPAVLLTVRTTDDLVLDIEYGDGRGQVRFITPEIIDGAGVSNAPWEVLANHGALGFEQTCLEAIERIGALLVAQADERAQASEMDQTARAEIRSLLRNMDEVKPEDGEDAL